MGLYTVQIVSQTDPIHICRLSCLRICSCSRFNVGNLQDSMKKHTLTIPLLILTHSALIIIFYPSRRYENPAVYLVLLSNMKNYHFR